MEAMQGSEETPDISIIRPNTTESLKQTAVLIIYFTLWPCSIIVLYNYVRETVELNIELVFNRYTLYYFWLVLMVFQN